VKDIGQDGLLATDHFAVLSSSSSNLIWSTVFMVSLIKCGHILCDRKIKKLRE
jgi:hypothetical protein